MSASRGSDPSYGERPFRFVSSLEVITLVVWEILLVFVFMLFSPPMGGANQAVGLPTSLLDWVPALTSLFYHSLALPLAALVVLVTLSVFEVGERRRFAIKHAITAGCLISSGAMIFILVAGESLLADAVLVFGMGLGASAVVALFLSLWPPRAPSASMRLLGFDLTQLAIWVVVAAVLASVAVGSYAALGESQWFSRPLLGQSPSLEAVHEGLIIAFINAAIVVLVVKWFRADRYLGAPGLLVKIGLYGVLLGTPAVALFAFAAMSTSTANAGAVTILSGVPMQASVFVMLAVMAEEVRRLHIRGLTGTIKESLTFGLLFLLYWADIAVALPAIYVIANSKAFSSQYDAPYYVATFQTGSEHALVTLTAVMLFMLVAVMFGVRGKIGALAGLSLISGYVLSTTAEVLYMFNLIPNGSGYVPYIGDGIALMVIGVLVALVGIFASSRSQVIHLRFPSAWNEQRLTSSTPESGRPPSQGSRSMWARLKGKGLHRYVSATRLARSSRARKAGAVTLALCFCVVPILTTVSLPAPGFKTAGTTMHVPPPYRQLTSGMWDDRSPAWSPNGSLIAYVSAKGGLWSVLVMNTSGSAAKQVSPPYQLVMYPKWSPDSSSISYWFFDGAVSGYEVVNLTTLSIKRIAANDTAAFQRPAEWSPDGSHLAFFISDPSQQLIVYDMKTGIYSPMASVSGPVLAVSWVSDDELIYSSHYNGSNRIMWVNLLTEEFGLLLGGLNDFAAPSVGPNGTMAYYSDFNPAKDSPLLQGIDGYTVCLPSVAGSSPDCIFILTNETGYDIWLSGVDGSNATFQSMIAEVEGLAVASVPYAPGTIALASPPAWSPDGTRVAYIANSSLARGLYIWSNEDYSTGDIWVANGTLTSVIYVWSTKDGSITPLGPLQGGASSFEPTWSPDGLNVAFASNVTGTYHIWVENMNSIGQA